MAADDIDEVVHLKLAALDTGDSLRRLAAKITAAGHNPQLQAEALAIAQRISRT